MGAPQQLQVGFQIRRGRLFSVQHGAQQFRVLLNHRQLPANRIVQQAGNAGALFFLRAGQTAAQAACFRLARLRFRHGPALFQRGSRQRGKQIQHVQIVFVELAWLLVDHAERAH